MPASPPARVSEGGTAGVKCVAGVYAVIGKAPRGAAVFAAVLTKEPNDWLSNTPPPVNPPAKVVLSGLLQ